jgi:hypothetical protein
VLSTWLPDFLVKQNSNINVLNSVSQTIVGVLPTVAANALSVSNSIGEFNQLATNTAGYSAISYFQSGEFYPKGKLALGIGGVYKSLADGYRSINPYGDAVNWVKVPGVSSSNTFNKRPILNLQFKGNNLNKKIVFSRNSQGTFLDKDLKIKVSTIDTPRIEFSNTGQCRGLLIEESRTNSLLNSNNFSVGPWGSSGTNVTVSPNAFISPDGAANASKITPVAGVNGGILGGARSGLSPSTTYTFSIFAKAGEYPRLGYDGTAYLWHGTVDLNTAAVVSNSAGTIVVEQYPNGWLRISGTGTTSSGASAIDTIIEAKDSTAICQQNFTADGVSGIYVWGAQIEAGSFMTSYIPTAASSVTRSADICSYPFIINSDLSVYSVADKIYNLPTAYSPVISLNTGNASRRLQLKMDASAPPNNVPTATFTERSGAITVDAGLTAPSIGKGIQAKFSASLSKSQILVNLNGYPLTLSGANFVDPTESLMIGTIDQTAFLNGHISEIMIWDSALSSVNLKLLCST